MLWLISSFLINADACAPNFLKDIIADSTQKPESKITTFPVLNIDSHNLSNNEAVFPNS